MAKILINNEININSWDDFLLKNHNSSVFHTRDFQRLNSNSIAIALEENDEIVALTILTLQSENGIKKLLTSRAIIYDFPLFKNKIHLELLNKFIVKKFKKQCIYLEIRNYSNKTIPKTVLKELKFKYLDYLNIRINAENLSLNDILSKMTYNRRREIKITLKKGIFWNEISNENELFKLYELLKKLYSTKVKLPLPKIDYFQSMFYSKCCKVFAIQHHDEIIGGAFCLYSKNQGIFTQYYFGSEQFSDFYPTHISVYAAIEFAKKENLKYIDLMGAGIKQNKYGVRNYKKQFGGELYESGRFQFVFKPLLFKIGSLAVDLFKKFNFQNI